MYYIVLELYDSAWGLTFSISVTSCSSDGWSVVGRAQQLWLLVSGAGSESRTALGLRHADRKSLSYCGIAAEFHRSETRNKYCKEKHKLRSRMLGCTNLGAMYCYLELKEWHMHVFLEFWDRTQHIWVSGDWRRCVSLVTVQWRRRNPKGTDAASRCWRIIVVNRCKFRRTVALSTKP